MGGVIDLENSLLAFQSAGQNGPPSLPSQYVVSLPVTAAVALGQIVAVSYSATSGLFTCAPAGAGAAGTIGVALAGQPLIGGLCPIVVYGPALVTASAALGAGTIFSSGAAGTAAAASATIGANAGILVQASSGAGQLVACWVCKS